MRDTSLEIGYDDERDDTCDQDVDDTDVHILFRLFYFKSIDHGDKSLLELLAVADQICEAHLATLIQHQLDLHTQIEEGLYLRGIELLPSVPIIKIHDVELFGGLIHDVLE
jgi:hypothetical protein